jgi:hypothetical protein
VARLSSASGRLQSAWILVIWSKSSSTRLGSYVGDDAITSTFPVSGSSATTAPQRLPSDSSAVRCARGSRLSTTSLPVIVAPVSRSTAVSSTVERFAFWPVR